jgi:hypothetical protein
MFGNKNKKYIERAGEILAQIAHKNLAKIKPVDEAARDLLQTRGNLAKIEKKFDVNRLEMFYYLLKRRYLKRLDFPSELEKKIKLAKKLTGLSDKESAKHCKKLLSEIRKGIQKLEKNIGKFDKNYQKQEI